LQRLYASKPLHGPFSPSKRLMRILWAIVEPATDLLVIGIVEISEPVAHGLKLPQPKTARKIGLTKPFRPLKQSAIILACCRQLAKQNLPMRIRWLTLSHM